MIKWGLCLYLQRHASNIICRAFLAVIDTATGRTRAHVAERTDGPGYQRLLAWGLQRAPGRRVWALEGTGSFAAGCNLPRRGR